MEGQEVSGSVEHSWAAPSGPWGSIMRGSMPGFSVWSLITHTHTHNRTACCGVRSVGSVLQSVLQM